MEHNELDFYEPDLQYSQLIELDIDISKLSLPQFILLVCRVTRLPRPDEYQIQEVISKLTSSATEKSVA